MPWRHTFLTTRSFGPSALTQVLHFVYNRALTPSAPPQRDAIRPCAFPFPGRCRAGFCVGFHHISTWPFLQLQAVSAFSPQKKLHFLHSYTTRRNILTATVDAEARTLTVDIKDDWGGYYTFAHVSDPTVNVVATVDDDGTVTFTDWTAWYVPYAYAYIYEGAVSVLVRKP